MIRDSNLDDIFAIDSDKALRHASPNSPRSLRACSGRTRDCSDALGMQTAAVESVPAVAPDLIPARLVGPLTNGSPAPSQLSLFRALFRLAGGSGSETSSAPQQSPASARAAPIFMSNSLQVSFWACSVFQPIPELAKPTTAHAALFGNACIALCQRVKFAFLRQEFDGHPGVPCCQGSLARHCSSLVTRP